MRNVLSLLAALCVVVTNEAGAETLAVVGGTVIDGNGGKPIADGVVLIEGKRIVAVGGKDTPIPAHARRIAAAGKFVIPGLMDANVHLVLDIFPVTMVRYEGRYDELAIEAAQLTLKNGVTTVFDTWGPREYLIKAREAINAGSVTASRIYLAGNIVGLDGPYSEDFIRPDSSLPEAFVHRVNAVWQENVGRELMFMSPEAVQKEISKYVQNDIDFLKYAVTAHKVSGVPFIEFSPRVQNVIVEEARRAGLTVQTHTTSGEGLHLAVQAGVDLMQHCDVTVKETIPAETVALIAQRKIPCAFLPNTDNALAWYREKSKANPVLEYYANVDLNDRALLKAGAVVLLSTDAGIFGEDLLNSSRWRDNVPPEQNRLILGEAHFDWLLAVEQKGMKPMDALMAATRNIARAYKVDTDLGTLEAGKIADMLILNANPLGSAKNYRSLSVVIKAGRIIERQSLPTRRFLTR